MILNRDSKELIKVGEGEKSYYVYPGSIFCHDKEGLIIDLPSPLHVAGTIICRATEKTGNCLKSRVSIFVTQSLHFTGDIKVFKGSLNILENLIGDGKINVEEQIICRQLLCSSLGSFATDVITDINCKSLLCFGRVLITGRIKAKDGYSVFGEIKDGLSLYGGVLSEKDYVFK